MLPFIQLFLFSFILVVFSLFNKRADKYTSIILIAILILFIGLRYNSVDYFSYLSIYNNIKAYGFEGFLKEKGFIALILLEQIFIGSFSFFIFLFAALSLIIKYIALRKLTQWVTLAIFSYIAIGLFSKDLGQIRNGLIGGIVLFSIYYAYHKKIFRFLLTIFLASQIHMSALLGLLIYISN